MKNRRGWLTGGVVALAALAGGGLAWWRFQPHAVDSGAEAAWWGLSFETPQGDATLSMASLRGRPLLVNFWATWCPPCVEELPLLNTFYREQRAKGWQFLGLAIDQPSAVRRFVQNIPIDFPVGMGGLGGTELGKSLGNSSGALPFTVVFGADGAVAHRKLGQVKPDDLAQWARSTT